MIKKHLVAFVIVFIVSLAFHPSVNAFSDLSDEKVSQIELLVKDEIITGYPDGTFRGNNPVTRAEAVIMIAKALKADVPGVGEAGFRDVPNNHFAKNYIYYAQSKKIVSGYNDGTFKPNNSLSRGDMSIVLTNAFKFTKVTEDAFTDVSRQDYYYTAIQAIYDHKVTFGAGGGTYRPKSAITRYEFSVMLARILDQLAETADQDDELVPDIMYVDVRTALNLRSGPGTNYSIITTLKRNQKVVVEEKVSDWYRVNTGSVVGFVNKAYLSKEEIKEIIHERIILDPGHGGKDPGASSNGIVEKNYVLDIGLKVRKALLAEGIDVVMTRETDRYLTLEERVNVAKKHEADGFISLHTNSFSSASANGTESFIRAASLNTIDEKSRKLSESIHKRLIEALGTKDRGVKQQGFYVIKYNPHPATLLEFGFISNKQEAALLDLKQKEIVEAVKNGVLDYYKWLGR